MASGCWVVFGSAFKGLKTIYATSTFTVHKSEGKGTHNEKERKIMQCEKLCKCCPHDAQISPTLKN